MTLVKVQRHLPPPSHGASWGIDYINHAFCARGSAFGALHSRPFRVLPIDLSNKHISSVLENPTGNPRGQPDSVYPSWLKSASQSSPLLVSDNRPRPAASMPCSIHSLPNEVIYPISSAENFHLHTPFLTLYYRS